MAGYSEGILEPHFWSALHGSETQFGSTKPNSTTPLPKSTPPPRVDTLSERQFDELKGFWSCSVRRMRLYKFS